MEEEIRRREEAQIKIVSQICDEYDVPEMY